METPGAGAKAALARAIWALAIGQTLAWAGLFYVFAAFFAAFAAQTGWDRSVLAFGVTIAVAVSALAAPLAGRLVDEGAGRWLLGGGTCLGGIAVIALAFVTTPAAYWGAAALIGLCAAGCLYEPCFALLTRHLGAKEARARIIVVTLAAGFASTLAFPAAALAVERIGLSAAILSFGLVVALVAAPLQFIGASLLVDHAPLDGEESIGARGAIRGALGRPSFWYLLIGFASVSFNHGLMITLVIPLLTALGAAGATAVLAASLIGPAQVIGRVVLMRLGAVVPNLLLAAIWVFGTITGAGILLIAGGSPLAAIAFAATQGAAQGLVSIMRPALVAEALGTRGFGAISGVITLPSFLAFAIAPSLGTLAWAVAGPAGVLICALAASLGAGAAFIGLRRRLAMR